MSVMPKMTLIGMYNYDNTLFEQIDLPTGIDKDLFVDSLLLEKGEMPVLYASLEFNKNAFGVWSRKWYHSIERMHIAFTEEYNPLHNFDRNEDYSDSESRTMTNSATGDTTETGKDTETGKTTSSATESATTSGKTILNSDRDTETNVYEGNEGNTENTVSAYNSDMYQPDTNTQETGTRTSDTNVNDNLNSTETTTGNSTGSSSGTTNVDRTMNISRNGKETRSGSENEKRDLTHKAHLYGNIGVTKSQEMLIDELNLRANHNIYDAIIEIFANEFLISVY